MADGRPDFDVHDQRLARAAWSRIAEPGDEVAGALVAALGPCEALDWLYGTLSSQEPAPGAVLAGLGGVGTPRARERLRRATARWAVRATEVDPRRELRVLDRLGGTLLVPGDPAWPTALADLGPASPWCLWVRGALPPDLGARSVALVGARACTEYGRTVATDLAEGLAARDFVVVSGGAYGIDAAAHRGALVGGAATVAFLAGGVDRLYPAGNADLLRAMVEAGGAVVSEVPPGSVPSRVRFLLRNRLIAAASTATVVVEAAWRSGSLSTAARAADLGRPVGAVPGPVTSMASSGSHRLLRDGAVCVTDVDEVADLAGRVGADLAPAHASPCLPEDDLDPVARRVLEALPVRSGAEAGSVARAAGLAPDETRGALGLLELQGLAVRGPAGWRRGARGGRARVGAPDPDAAAGPAH
ncbi:DNA protecting protein DprA [Sediminihabitans luteus]|uniref:DNA protecting protein DprA n=1 Tax=Sediminihabitans luteus TaxID=1138585 RepID=A0A2M9CC87_9CELL|nr:DNA-processing protein DprA [Sediminihabitans luteus]PJJ68995.1 DNA protecting protein DprA [Sediminihabitans luteus]GII99379.1 DNA processing protein DprA [Sediminihabitans luteus]